MPATTPNGLPYPLPTEPVAEGAQAIRNLAESLDPIPAARKNLAFLAIGGGFERPGFDPDGTTGFVQGGITVAVGPPPDLVIARPGIYAVHAWYGFTGSGGSNRGFYIAYKRGAAAEEPIGWAHLIATSGVTRLNVSGIVKLAAGDKVYATIYDDNAADSGLGAAPYGAISLALIP